MLILHERSGRRSDSFFGDAEELKISFLLPRLGLLSIELIVWALYKIHYYYYYYYHYSLA